MHLFIHRPESWRRRTAQAKVAITVFHRVAGDLGAKRSQAVICQVSSVPVRRNHGGRGINKYSLKPWTCGSYIWRRSRSFCSGTAPSCNTISAFANISRKAVKLEEAGDQAKRPAAAIPQKFVPSPRRHDGPSQTSAAPDVWGRRLCQP